MVKLKTKVCREKDCSSVVESPYDYYCGFHSLQCDICEKRVSDVFSHENKNYCYDCYDLYKV